MILFTAHILYIEMSSDSPEFQRPTCKQAQTPDSYTNTDTDPLPVNGLLTQISKFSFRLWITCLPLNLSTASGAESPANWFS